MKVFLFEKKKNQRMGLERVHAPTTNMNVGSFSRGLAVAKNEEENENLDPNATGETVMSFAFVIACSIASLDNRKNGLFVLQIFSATPINRYFGFSEY